MIRKTDRENFNGNQQKLEGEPQRKRKVNSVLIMRLGGERQEKKRSNNQGNSSFKCHVNLPPNPEASENPQTASSKKQKKKLGRRRLKDHREGVTGKRKVLSPGHPLLWWKNWGTFSRSNIKQQENYAIILSLIFRKGRPGAIHDNQMKGKREFKQRRGDGYLRSLTTVFIRVGVGGKEG